MTPPEPSALERECAVIVLAGGNVCPRYPLPGWACLVLDDLTASLRMIHGDTPGPTVAWWLDQEPPLAWWSVYPERLRCRHDPRPL